MRSAAAVQTSKNIFFVQTIETTVSLNVHFAAISHHGWRSHICACTIILCGHYRFVGVVDAYLVPTTSVSLITFLWHELCIGLRPDPLSSCEGVATPDWGQGSTTQVYHGAIIHAGCKTKLPMTRTPIASIFLQKLRVGTKLWYTSNPSMESDSFAATTQTTSTVIPIREEIRLCRFWFFHHDLRAFTTSVWACMNLVE